MKNRWVALWVLLATAVVFGSVSAAPSEEMRAREELQAWYGKIVDAYSKKDLEAYMSLFAQNVKMRDFQGKTRDRKAVEALAKEDMAATGKIHWAKFEITKLALKDHEATVISNETWKYVFTDLKGELGPKGKSYDVVWRSSAQCKFLKTSDGWLAKYREAIGPERLTTGGKPLVPLVESKKRKKQQSRSNGCSLP